MFDRCDELLHLSGPVELIAKEVGHDHGVYWQLRKQMTDIELVDFQHQRIASYFARQRAVGKDGRGHTGPHIVSAAVGDDRLSRMHHQVRDHIARARLSVRSRDQDDDAFILQLAEHIGGSVDGFVQMMNARAAELGCTNTVFTNPTGLPDENQHTTAHDMALIMKAAADNESFQTIASTASYTIPATNVSGGDRVLTNNFSMLANNNAAYYQYCTGGREGYTEASGSTLVCSAQKNGITLIAVVLQGTSGTTATEAASLLNYGFDNFNMLSLGDNDFNMLSGGDVYVPVGTTADVLTTQDGEVQDGQYSRQYLFGGTAVGTSVMAATQEEDTSLVDTSVQNIDAARNYTENRNNLPYFIIGGVGILLLLLILLRIIKIAKS